jgi:hypothetical protein
VDVAAASIAKTQAWPKDSASRQMRRRQKRLFMSSGFQRFRETEVARAIRATEKAGLKVGRIEIEGKKIIVVVGADGAASTKNEWDEVLPSG